MYTSFSIENFRLFEQLTVEPLARVNLIAGQNNAGKTALLEALCLHAMPIYPQVAWMMSIERGLPGTEPGEFFTDLFHEYKSGSHINFKAVGDWDGSLRTLAIHRQPRAMSEFPLMQNPRDVPQTSRMIFDNEFRDELIFDYQDENEKCATARAWIQPDIQTPRTIADSGSFQWDSPNSGVNFARSLILSSFGRLGDQELSATFGQAVREGHLSTVEKIIQVLEPRLQSLQAVPNRFGTSLIYADTGVGRMVPVALMGEGVKRLLTLALAFLHSRDAVILIDEIENGLHYSVLTDVWKWLNRLSQEFNVQVFATTHSYECIVAANNAFAESESDELHLHHLYRRNERVKAVTYNNEALHTNIEYFWELR